MISAQAGLNWASVLLFSELWTGLAVNKGKGALDLPCKTNLELSTEKWLQKVIIIIILFS